MILKINNLSFSYGGDLVLDRVSFAVRKGEFLGVIGPNGGGKSTLLKCILNLCEIPPKAIEINAKKLSYVPQIAGLNAAFATSVVQVVLSGALDAKSLFFTPKSHKIRAQRALELVGMREYERCNIFELSGGQQQRVLIARALMSECDLLLLDEPTASIDVRGQSEIFRLLDELNSNLNLSIICVCHDLALLGAYAARVLHVNRRAHMHEFCEHERSKRLAMLAASADEFCQIDALKAACDLGH